MQKRSKIKELIRSKLKKQIKEGNIKEGWLDNFIDGIFDKATDSRVKNDPTIKKLGKDMEKAVSSFQSKLIKRYGSWDKVPQHYKNMI